MAKKPLLSSENRSLKLIMLPLFVIICSFILLPGCGGTENKQSQQTAGENLQQNISALDTEPEDSRFYPPSVTFSSIREAVSPFGKWIDVPVYGEVWKPDPDIVGENWIPYTMGQWIYTSWGWTWISDFDKWGWAAFHYGRFAYTPTDGWVMITDILWAPAHVLWKESQNMIGWAPLSPGYSVMEATTFGSSVHVSRKGWTFVPKEKLISPDLARHFLSERNKILIFRYACTLNQWKKKGEISHYSGPDPQALVTETDIKIPFYTFRTAKQRFKTRFLPDRQSLPSQNKQLFQYSEVRLDIGDRIAVVGPDSPRKLPKRKKRKIYYSSSTTTDDRKKTAQKTTNIKRPKPTKK